MKVYIDIILLINFFCDFLVLYSVSVILKRNIKFKRILLASLFGSLSIVTLFIKLDSFNLFILKIFLGSIMIIICYGYKSFKFFFNNLLYFFTNSLLLGGFIYLINIKLKNKLIESYFYNFFFILVFSPLVLYLYTKILLKLKNEYSLKYKIDIYINGELKHINGYLDTGSLIRDPYKFRPIVIVNDDIFNKMNINYILVPCDTVESSFLMKCFKPDYVYIKGFGTVNNCLIGISKKKINIEGVDCLINKNILEEK